MNLVYLENGQLMLDGQPFRHIGANVRGLCFYGTSAFPNSTTADITTNLQTFRDMGASVIRIFAAHESLSIGENVDRLAWLADMAASYNLRLWCALTNLYANGFQPRGDRAFCSPTPSGFNIYNDDWYRQNYAVNWLPFVNGVTDRLRGHPGVIAWELGNELKDEASPATFAGWAIDLADYVKDRDPGHLIATGWSMPDDLLTPDLARATYYHFDIVTEHRYETDTRNNIGLATELGCADVVTEAAYRASCGNGGRAGLLADGLRAWFGRGTQGYHWWGSQAQGRDIGDGDNIYGMDKYCHTDFGDLFRTFAQYVGASGTNPPGNQPGPPPPSPGSPPPPPGGNPPPPGSNNSPPGQPPSSENPGGESAAVWPWFIGALMAGAAVGLAILRPKIL